jgi:hypothetical protein
VSHPRLGVSHPRLGVSHPRRPLCLRAADERGVALIIALMSVALMMALGLALTLATMTEVQIASNYRDGVEALYAADAAVERVIQDVWDVPDWNSILDGTVTPAFVDGPPSGARTIAGGTLDLVRTTNMVRCGKVSTCGDADMDAATGERPWRRNNPRWQLYAYGPMSDMLPTESIDSQMYVVVWIADDPSESDDNPLKDGLPKAGCETADPACANPGKGVLAMLAHAYGPGGVRRVVEVTLSRSDASEIEPGRSGVRVLAWRDVR